MVKQFYSTPIDETLQGTTTQSQSGPGSNDNEGILNIPQSSRTRTRWFNHIQDTTWEGVFFLYRDAVYSKALVMK